MFQSTHPHGVRLDNYTEELKRLDVSIHAPTWGATADAEFVRKMADTFQSTHPHGVRLIFI